MKKALFLILAIAVCLTLINIPALAADNLKLDKSNYAPSEEIVATVTRGNVDLDIVGVYKKGAGIFESESVVVLSGESQVVEGSLYAPSENGDYEVRLYDVDGKLVASIQFTVGETTSPGVPNTPGGPQDAAANLILNKSDYAPNEEVIATVTRGSIDLDIIGIWEKGVVGISEYLSAVTLAGESQVVEGSLYAPGKNGEYEVRLYDVDGKLVASKPFTVSGAQITSGWANEQKIPEKAMEYELIPDSLKGMDWTKPITRAEFAAACVKLYENLTGTKTTPISPNPFTDTSDPEVLKAVSVDITNGMSPTTFSPNDLLTREQMATMLTRVLKKAYISGWTLKEDSAYTLNFTQPAKFADDALISGYARESVYFMFANDIVGGTGNNNFSPKASSTSEQAIIAASATREQSLAIAVRIVERLKDQPLDYSENRD